MHREPPLTHPPNSAKDSALGWPGCLFIRFDFAANPRVKRIFAAAHCPPAQASTSFNFVARSSSIWDVGMARIKYLELRSISLMLLVSPFLLQLSLAQNCGTQGGGALCQSGMCCSNFGYCGSGDEYCASGNCQSQCPSSPNPPSGGGPGVGSIVSSAIFDQIFPQRNSFYSYDAFISASSSYASFGTTGTFEDQAREIAAFLAHVSHETGGLAKINEDNPPMDYCLASNTQYPCVAGQRYYGRGPLQISWNYNYGAAGQSAAIGKDLLSTPDLVAQDPVVSFQTALWFWTTAQSPKPSCHDVMTGNWSPSAADTAAGRQAGFGLTIDIINGGLECGTAASAEGQAQASARVSLFQSISSILSVSPGTNLDCQTMQPYDP